MTYKELQDSILLRLDEDLDNIDPTVLSLIKNAINHCYVNDMSTLDKRVSSTYIPAVNHILTMPDDFIETENITPELSIRDKRVGNSVIINSDTDDTTYNLIYSAKREALSGDTDEVDLDSSLIETLTLYCCYIYYVNQNNLNFGNQFLNDYRNSKEEYKLLKPDYSLETVYDYYADTNQDE